MVSGPSKKIKQFLLAMTPFYRAFGHNRWLLDEPYHSDDLPPFYVPHAIREFPTCSVADLAGTRIAHSAAPTALIILQPPVSNTNFRLFHRMKQPPIQYLTLQLVVERLSIAVFPWTARLNTCAMLANIDVIAGVLKHAVFASSNLTAGI